MSPRLRLLSRTYCHLCTDMLAELQDLQRQFGFEIEVIDIDTDEVLLARYDEFVPVLLAGERELCHYHLDSRAVIEFVQHQGFSGEAKPLESRP